MKIKGNKSYYSFIVPIYEVPVIVIVTKHGEDLCDALKRLKFSNDIIDLVDVNSQGCVVHEDPYGLILLMNEYSGYYVLSHEIFHLTHRILYKRDMCFDIDNHEQFAYLNGWLTYHIINNIEEIVIDENIVKPKKITINDFFNKTNTGVN
jgi:hypothetical protein